METRFSISETFFQRFIQKYTEFVHETSHIKNMTQLLVPKYLCLKKIGGGGEAVDQNKYLQLQLQIKKNVAFMDGPK